MEAKDKRIIQEEILRRFAGTDPEMDIDWDMIEISFKAGRQEEAKDIINCVTDAYRVHPDWGIRDVLDLLTFREETKEAIKRQRKPN